MLRRSLLFSLIYLFICGHIFGQTTPQLQLLKAAAEGNLQQVQTLLDQQIPVDTKDTDTGHTALMAASLNGHTEIVSFLIGKKANVNAKDRDGSTALMAAAAAGHVKIAELLINAKANVNAADKVKDTALILAAAAEETEMVSNLIGNKAKVKAKDSYGETALSIAVLRDNIEIAKLLINAKADVNAVFSENKITPLMAAVANNNAEMVKILLAAKAKVNAASSDKFTPLMIAAETGNTEIAKLLINAKASINAKDSQNATALIWAALNGSTEVAKLLLESKASVDVQSKSPPVKGSIVAAAVFVGVISHLSGGYGGISLLLGALQANAQADIGYSALMVAAIEGNDPIVKMLLDYKAKVNLRSNLNMTPLYLAAEGGHASTVKMLLAAGADIKARHKLDRNTVLLEGIRSGDLETVKLLLAAGANVSENNIWGLTPLMRAAQQDTAILKAVLDAGPKDPKFINAASNDKSTALMFAVAEGNADNVKMLLDAGADAKLKTNRDETALILAADLADADIITLLVSAGAETNIKTKAGVTPAAAFLANGAYRVRAGFFRGARGRIGSLPLSVNMLFDTKETARLSAEKPAYGVPELKANVLQAFDFEIFKTLVKQDVNTKDNDDITYLMLAAATNNEEAVKYLLQAKADVNAPSKNGGDTAICFAAYSGNAEIFNSLFSAGAKADHSNKSGTNVLMYAAAGGNADIVRALLKANVDAKAKNRDNATALMASANEEITKILVEAGTDVNSKFTFFRTNLTPLMFAAQRGDAGSFRYLVSKGANLNDIDRYKTGIFTYAAYGGNEELIDFCLDKGLPLNPATGYTPLAASFGHGILHPISKPGIASGFMGVGNIEVEKRYINDNVIEKLLDAGADVNAGSVTPLFCAVLAAPVEYVVFLLSVGADPSRKSKAMFNMTPLKYLEFLVQNGSEMTEDQEKSYALLKALEKAKKGKGKYPHPHSVLRKGLLSDIVEYAAVFEEIPEETDDMDEIEEVIELEEVSEEEIEDAA